MADFPTSQDNSQGFIWPEQSVQAKLTSNKIPKRTTKQQLLGFLVIAMYIAPLMIAAALIEPYLKDELIRKVSGICVFFFGGLSIVMAFSTAPNAVANLYQNRKLKQAEILCRLYLFFIANFSPYSYEAALMFGLLSEVLRAQSKLDEAEMSIRQGIEACLINENLCSVHALEGVPDGYKKLAQQSAMFNSPIKGMLYESLGTILRDKKMYKLAVEAGKRSMKMIEDKLRELQTLPKDASKIGMITIDKQKPLLLALASSQYELALTYLSQNDSEHALPLLKSAHSVRLEHPNTPYYMANVLSALGRAYLLSDETDKAFKCGKEALDLVEKAKLPVEELALARAFDVLSQVNAKKNKREESKRLCLQAKAIRERWLSPSDPERTV